MRTRGVDVTTSQQMRGGVEAPLRCHDGVRGHRPAVTSSRPPSLLHAIFVLVVVSAPRELFATDDDNDDDDNDNDDVEDDENDDGQRY